MYEEILYEVKDAVAIVTLNRPKRLNALTTRLLTEMRHALAQAEADTSVLGIVLTGAGRGFSAGMDMDSLSATAAGSDGEVEDLSHLEADLGDPAMGPDFEVTWGYLLKLRKPLIAAVNGPCAGLGFAIAMLCDMRFASDSARFTTSFAQRGLIAEHGTSWILPRLIGPSRALDLLWSARKVEAEEALRMGLVDRVVPHDELLAQTRAYIESLSSSSPTSLMVIKQQVYRHLMQPLGDAMHESNRLMQDSLASADFKEGVTSFMERRPPRFPPIGK